MTRKACLLAVGIGLLAAAPAGATEPGQTIISSDYGSLTVAAILEALAVGRIDGSSLDRNGDHVIDDLDDAYANNHFDFMAQRARIILKGSLLSPNLTYLFQGDATLAEFMLDAKMSYAIPEGEGISTTISGGRFLPPFTLILPRLVSRLGTINYPLYLFTPTTAGYAALQPFAFPGTIGRQVGLLVTQKLTPMFQLDVGVFNGFQRTIQPGSWADDNDYKDFFARIQLKPVEGLTLAVDYWLGCPESLDNGAPAAPFAVSATDPTYQHDTDHFAVFEAEYTGIPGLTLMGEFAYTHQTLRTLDVSVTPNVRSERSIDGLGGWFHVGYNFKDLLGPGADFELVARYDIYDPDIDRGDNRQMLITFGPQFFLEGLHSQIRLNYLFNISQNPALPGTDMDEQRHELWLQLAVEI